MRLKELLCKGCKKHFGFRYRSYMGIIRDLEYYKDGYCKDCYLEKVESELADIKRTWIKPVPIY